MLHFAQLGPVAVGMGGMDQGGCAQLLVQPAGIPTMLLSVLLLHPNQVVSRERLAASVWGEDPPSAVGSGLRNHIARLRRQLGPEAGARVRTVAPGYLIEVGPGELDTELLISLCARGRAALASGDLTGARVLLHEAAKLWRGEPLTELPTTGELVAQVHSWHEMRLVAQEGLLEAELGLGRHHEVAAELRTLAAAHPLREGMHGLLMRALYGSGRQAEALQVYQALRAKLLDDLGVDPSPALQRLHGQILRADAALQPEPAHEPISASGAAFSNPVSGEPVDQSGAASGSGPAGHAMPRPRVGGLPVDTRAFTGRENELAWLLELGQQAASAAAGAMAPVLAIDGMGGVGKSALVVHAAHRLHEEFADGSLYLDLHGNTPGIEPLSAFDALGELLRALGAASELIPRTPAARATAFQERLAGTRMLLVLDNAASSAEIRALLPNEPGCLVLVTSRRRLGGLDGAHQRVLDPLPPAEARALLSTIAGPGRIPPQSLAATELAALCGSLPLTLRIAAARLRRRRSLQVEDIVAELRAEQGRRPEPEDDHDGAFDVGAIFTASYEALPEADQELFRLLGLVPGPDIDANAVAWLLGTDRRGAQYRLESLIDHSLLQEPSLGRYRLHDLVRLFARSSPVASGHQGPSGQMETARGRLVDYYLYGASLADGILARRTRPTPPLGPVPQPLPMPTADDTETALTWWRTEWDNVLACADDQDVARQRAGAASAFSAVIGAFSARDGRSERALHLHERALAESRAGGDHVGEAACLTEVGSAQLILGANSQAQRAHEEALTAYRQLGDRFGEADSLWHLGRVRHMAHDHAAAAVLHQQALACYRELGSVLGEANALWCLGRSERELGDLDGAAERINDASVRYRHVGDELGTANSLWELGRLAELRDEFEGALGLYDEALTAYERTGSRLGVANVLGYQGRALRRMGRLESAAARLQAALAVLEDLRERHGLTLVRHDLGLVRWAQGDLEAATCLLTLVADAYRGAAEPVGAARSLHELAQVRRDAGDFGASARLLTEALAFSRKTGDARRVEEILAHARRFAAEAAAAFPTQ